MFFAVCTCESHGEEGCLVHTTKDIQGTLWKQFEESGSQQVADMENEGGTYSGDKND